MEIAKQRIQECIKFRSYQLNIAGLGLTELPDNLPTSLQILDCSYNKITEIGSLPPSLQKLDCSNNRITELKNLPVSLLGLYCSNNRITELKNLPALLCG